MASERSRRARRRGSAAFGACLDCLIFVRPAVIARGAFYPPSSDSAASQLRRACRESRSSHEEEGWQGTHHSGHTSGFPSIYSLCKLSLFSIFSFGSVNHQGTFKYQVYEPHLSRSINNKKENWYAQDTNFLAEETETSAGGTGWEPSCKPRSVYKTSGVCLSLLLIEVASLAQLTNQ